MGQQKRMGQKQKHCEKCGYTILQNLSRPVSVKPKAAALSYNGRKNFPQVEIRLANGKILDDKYYSCLHEENNIDPGTYHMKIQLKNGYEGILECTYQIVKSDCEIRYHGKDEIVGSYDEAIPLKITANRRNAKMIYKVSDPKSLTVDEKGIIRAKNVGRYTVTVYIPEDGNYKRSNEIKVKVRIIPAKIKLQSAKAKLRRKISIKWIRDTKVQGYHISYSTNKNMLNSKTITIKKNKTTSAVLKNLKSKKKYYIEIYGLQERKVGKRYTDVIGPVTKKTIKQNKNMLYNRKERVFAGGRNMRKIKRIIICVIMAFVMICVGNNAFSKARDIKAEETQNNELKGTYGDNLTWNFKDGVLKISGTGEIARTIFRKNK